MTSRQSKRSAVPPTLGLAAMEAQAVELDGDLQAWVGRIDDADAPAAVGHGLVPQRSRQPGAPYDLRASPFQRRLEICSRIRVGYVDHRADTTSAAYQLASQTM